MAIYSLEGFAPQIHPTVWVAESAEIIGKVIIKEHASIWPKTVIRGDGEEYIEIKKGANIQDQCVLHYDKNYPLIIGENVTVGHQCLLHGCQIENNVLIGMASVILNGAKIGKNSFVGARSFITENKTFPEGVLIKGSPAKIARDLTPKEILYIEEVAKHYQENARHFQKNLVLMENIQNPR